MADQLLVRVDDSWNPLEDYGPPPRYVPDRWTGTHVGQCLAEAFATLQIAAVARGPAAYGNAWPPYEHDWPDLLAQRQKTEAELAADAVAKNWSRPIPSAIELSRMEEFDRVAGPLSRQISPAGASRAVRRPSSISAPVDGSGRAPASSARPDSAPMERRGLGDDRRGPAGRPSTDLLGGASRHASNTVRPATEP